MSDLDLLRSKILELKRKRDDLSSLASKDRMEMTALDEQISDLERQKLKIKMNCDEREGQARKYDELIRQSEIALDKMKMNTMKLSEALNSALEDGI